MRVQKVKLVAPDGGWGWMVCLGCSMIPLSLRSIEPSFGLLFGDLLKNLSVDTTGASVIISLQDAVINFSGLFVGPLIKKFSYRRVAFCGSILSCIGLMLTSRANSMAYIICTHSILGGFGTGLATAASFVALNSYFHKKRGQATGFSMAGTSLAMMLWPQVINLLLTSYDFVGAIMIIGALALHSVVGTCLLQPVGWHMKKAQINEEMKSLTNGKDVEKHVFQEEEQEGKVDVKNAALEVSFPDLTLSCLHHEGTICEKANDDAGPDKKKSFVQAVVDFFDLDLLRNAVFLNVLTGLSLFYVAEMNFKFLTPFFLSSIGMTKAEVAFCLSLTAFSDIVARLTVPTICDKLKFKKRHVFWASSICVAIGRSVMVEQTPGKTLIVVLIINGFIRGIALTNFNITISESCSLEKLPAALGLFMVSKGLFIVCLGPIVGYIRDFSNSYKLCMHVMTGFIALGSLMWGVEYCVRKIRLRKTSKVVSDESLSE